MCLPWDSLAVLLLKVWTPVPSLKGQSNFYSHTSHSLLSHDTRKCQGNRWAFRYVWLSRILANLKKSRSVSYESLSLSPSFGSSSLLRHLRSSRRWIIEPLHLEDVTVSFYAGFWGRWHRAFPCWLLRFLSSSTWKMVPRVSMWACLVSEPLHLEDGTESFHAVFSIFLSCSTWKMASWLFIWAWRWSNVFSCWLLRVLSSLYWGWHCVFLQDQGDCSSVFSSHIIGRLLQDLSFSWCVGLNTEFPSS